MREKACAIIRDNLDTLPAASDEMELLRATRTATGHQKGLIELCLAVIIEERDPQGSLGHYLAAVASLDTSSMGCDNARELGMHIYLLHFW